MSRSVLKLKFFGFAIRIVRLFQHLQGVRKEYVLTKQLLRCGTSVGAMIREAEYAESKSDFIHKMAIAQKEINETLYWLDLLAATDYLIPKESESLQADALELLKMLTSTIKTAKANLSE
ncbi:four helix bundle protein [Hymenobacter sp.]|uniref:four helix bundle protein n=1 Tax=Hymenobacter sp. TaxID=1898978 RepID=UPI00286C504D|nr:four helix bundle protein [Hymenobacter sp.]